MPGERPGGKAPAGRGGRPPIRMEKRVKSTKTPLVLLGVALAVLLGVLLPVLLPARSGRVASSALPGSAAGPPAPSASLAPASLPASDVGASAQAGPALAFTEEEKAELDALLGEWAAKETQITVTQDADGQPLETPYSAPGGGHNVSVWFLDIDSGAQYSYNARQPFYYASMMKAPYAAYLYELARQGRCDLDEVITVEEKDVAPYRKNTGVIRTMPVPAPFTVEQLIGYSITDSDTAALKVLLKHYGAEGFVQWAEGQGVAQAEALHSVIYGEVDAAGAGALLQAVYRVMQENPHGAKLRGYMEQAANRMITSQYPVAHKYGWDTKAYHDMAAVFAPHPYLLVIMTDKWGGSYEETLVFAQIAQKLEGMMQEKYSYQGA